LPVSTEGQEAAIAGHSAQRFRGNARSVLQCGRPGSIWPEHLLIQVNHDLEALAASSRHGIGRQERLCELHRPISPRGPARFRGRGYPFNRSWGRMERWNNSELACTTPGRWGTSRPGSGPMGTAWTTWSGCAGPRVSCARVATTAELGG